MQRQTTIYENIKFNIFSQQNREKLDFLFFRVQKNFPTPSFPIPQVSVVVVSSPSVARNNSIVDRRTCTN